MRRHRSSNRRFVFRAVLVTATATLLISAATGCGGWFGSNPPRPAPTPSPAPIGPLAPSQAQTTRATLAIRWPARSRAIDGPAAALSATVTLIGAGLGNSAPAPDVQWIANRDSSRREAHVSRHTSPMPARVGTWSLVVRFFSKPNGTGDIIAVATAIGVRLEADGTLPESIALTARATVITSLVLAEGQSVMVGEAQDMPFEARDANKNLIALEPGAVFLALEANSDRLRVTDDSRVEGLRPGAARIIARLDDLTSAPVTVTVTSRAAISVSPDAATITAGAAQPFMATVSGVPNGEDGVTWRVQEGDAGGTVTAAGVYQAPTAPGAYHLVATSRFDPSKNAVVTITVQAPAPSGGDTGGSMIIVQ